MASDHLLLIELVLVLGAVLGWSAWELLALRRDRRRREAQQDAPGGAPASGAEAPTRASDDARGS
jgi:hypothetical protein